MRHNIYVVYNPETKQVIKTFSWFGMAEDYAKEHGLKWLNRTHPINKELLTQLKPLEDDCFDCDSCPKLTKTARGTECGHLLTD